MERDKSFFSFNQDYSCISIGNRNGFSIYQIDPLKKSSKKNYGNGIKIIKMLNTSNILFFVERDKPKELIIYDDSKKEELTRNNYDSNITNIKVLDKNLVISTIGKLHIYDFIKDENIGIIETNNNENGIFDINKKSTNLILAYPDKFIGAIKIKFFESNTTTIINAHKHNISFISLNSNGTMVSTASEIGTLIRIFNTNDGNLLKEIRRGFNNSLIYDIIFSENNLLLGVSSNKKTIHIFSIEEAYKKISFNYNLINEIPQNKKSIFKKLPKFFFDGYFQSEWSFMRININEKNCLLGLINDDILIAINENGKYYKISLDLKNGKNYEIINSDIIFDI